MVKKLRTEVRACAARTTTRRKSPELNDEQEKILREATIHLARKHGLFLLATGVREARVRRLRVWIITVNLRYTTGHEGYVGDLLYDGKDFTFLTEQSVMDERTRKIAADPERLRKWHEHQASTLPAGEG